MRLRLGLIGLISAIALFTIGYVLSEYAGLYAAFSAFGKLKVEGVPPSVSATQEKITATAAGESLSPDISLSVSKVDFGYVPIGRGESEFVVKLTNTGNAPLRISEIEVPAGQFALSRSPVLPASIGPGVRVTFGVSLSAVTPGRAAATATIVTNAPTARVEIPLEATVGGAAEVVVANNEDSNVNRLSRTGRPLIMSEGTMAEPLPAPPLVAQRSINLPVSHELGEALQWLAVARPSPLGQADPWGRAVALATNDSYSSEDGLLLSRTPRSEPVAEHPAGDVAQSGREVRGNQISGAPETPSSNRDPGIKILSPADGGTVSGVVSLRTELEAEDEVSGATLEIDGEKLKGEYKQSESLLEITFDTRLLTDGPHKVSVEVISKVGKKMATVLTLWVANRSEGKPK